MQCLVYKLTYIVKDCIVCLVTLYKMCVITLHYIKNVKHMNTSVQDELMIAVR